MGAAGQHDALAAPARATMHAPASSKPDRAFQRAAAAIGQGQRRAAIPVHPSRAGSAGAAARHAAGRARPRTTAPCQANGASASARAPSSSASICSTPAAGSGGRPRPRIQCRSTRARRAAGSAQQAGSDSTSGSGRADQRRAPARSPILRAGRRHRAHSAADCGERRIAPAASAGAAAAARAGAGNCGRARCRRCWGLRSSAGLAHARRRAARRAAVQQRPPQPSVAELAPATHRRQPSGPDARNARSSKVSAWSSR